MYEPVEALLCGEAAGEGGGQVVVTSGHVLRGRWVTCCGEGGLEKVCYTTKAL